jgi:hypothetical protein
MCSQMGISKKNYIFLSLSFLLSLSISCTGLDPFSTPQETMRTFIKAYNSEDKDIMKRCGIVDDVLNILTYENEHAGLMKHIPVQEIKMKIISCTFDTPDITKIFTTENSIVTVEFTSETKKDFYVKEKILVSKKRHSFQDFSEASKWQIMGLAD